MIPLGLIAVVAVFAGCGGSGGGVDAVETMPRSIAGETAGEASAASDTGAGEAAGSTDDDGPPEILEFGLFGPVVPVSDSETYESDCRFENDPYETCL